MKVNLVATCGYLKILEKLASDYNKLDVMANLVQNMIHNRYDSVQCNSVQCDLVSIGTNLVRFSSGSFNSVRFGSQSFISIRFDSVRFSLIQFTKSHIMANE